MFTKYNYVLGVYREQSFTKAAQKLFISQPTLSVAIRTIEERLGAPLFERPGGCVLPTEVGREYIAAAEQIAKIEREFSHRLDDICGLETGRLAVGGSNYLSCYVLPKIITKFSAQYPKVEVVPVEANSLALSELLERDEVDVIIDNVTESKDRWECEPLTNERILLCVPSSNPINEGLTDFRIRPEDLQAGTVDPDTIPSLPLERFRNEKFILLKNGHNMHHRAIKAFESAGFSPNVPFLVDQMNISYALSESGMGLCFVTDTFVHYSHPKESICLYNISEEHGCRTLFIARKKNKYCTHAMREFIRIAQEVMATS